jgi:AAA15 family ATPase/GTPase
MTWQPLHIKGLSFNGPNKTPAVLEFRSGLNVIWGPSNAGKSFAVEAIDFLLGSSRGLTDIPQRNGYDRARLVLESPTHDLFTIQRSTNGGGFRLYEGTVLASEPQQEGRTLQARHAGGRTDNLSGYLLFLIGLSDKFVQTNQNRNTRSLSFRDLSKLIIVKEAEIIKDSSPILTGQYPSRTVEFSVFKLLLTGVDDSAQVAQEERVTELDNIRQNNIAKIELIDEFISNLQVFIDESGVNRIQVEERIAELNQQIRNQEAILTQVRSELNERQLMRRQILSDIQNLSNRVDEIDSQLSRFALLQNSYQVDIDRLDSIEESGSFFVHLERTPCPLCGTPPNEQHQNESCDGNVEQVVHAARGEITKIRKLSEELEQTISELTTERSSLYARREQMSPRLQELTQEIEGITAPLSGVEVSLSYLVSQMSEQQQILDKFNQLNLYRERKQALLRETPQSPPRRSAVETSSIDLSTTVLDDYAQHVLHLLQSWNFPEADRAYFDSSARDLVINGQLRSSNGKGVRAVTHAAMTIGLMEFCQQRDLPHPGFVVLDSPLLAYKSPEEAEDEDLSEEDRVLAASDVKPRFYDYLSHNLQDSQVIIMENTSPPLDLGERSNVIHFTKREDIGRYGFFPISF